MIARREVLMGGAALAALAAAFYRSTDATEAAMTATTTATTDNEFTRLSDADWKRRLTGDQYYVLRKHGTERAGSSPLNHEKRKGTFACAGCAQPLFSSDTKFESGTGWPSFWKPLDGAVGTQTDRSFFMTRTEVHCARCLGHLGHVFEDGPPPTGLRYCMNGIAMTFTAAPAA
jgi:peptide-methionine (R)-S-oxide reductase